MKLKYFFYLICMLFGCTVLSCKSTVPAINETVKTTTVIETIRDTVFKTEKDSSFYEAYLECVNGKVVVKKETVTPSKNGHLQTPKVQIKDNKLSSDCEVYAQELIAKLKTKETTNTLKEKVPVYYKEPLTAWETVQIWFGRIFLLVIVAAIVWLLFKFKII
ncbi:hypothetical protein [Flavobacterium cerinum]|uniref:Lipoprotein n=1 Tax=Flavobacterium cerinum TaxID=2502784 RepID=A0A444HEE7_9FLAO|nr:hypothetical protein [Flavobacterium cerinum]RWX03365.1 hypothetical protein EPI11_00100 [Flavobacterium cerinum]